VVQRLAERPTGFFPTQLRPEKGQDDVPPVESPRMGQREVGQQGETLGLGRDQPHGRRLPFEQLERPKRMKTKHIDASLAAVTGTDTRVTRGG